MKQSMITQRDLVSSLGTFGDKFPNVEPPSARKNATQGDQTEVEVYINTNS